MARPLQELLEREHYRRTLEMFISVVCGHPCFFGIVIRFYMHPCFISELLGFDACFVFGTIISTKFPTQGLATFEGVNFG